MDSLFPTASAHEYTITSDLSQLCLPREYKDSNRRLAWANSICCLFVIIGIAGLKPPKVNVKPLSTPTEIIPVVINQPEETPPTPQDQPPEPDTTPEVTPETPVVATVVAADASAVSFAVPVQGPVILAPARFAAPPPANTAPPKATTFIPGQGDKGSFPWPRSYTREMYEQRAQGTVLLYVEVDTTGVPSKVEIKESSGFGVLDKFAAQWVRDKWRWMPGEVRRHFVPFQFKLQ